MTRRNLGESLVGRQSVQIHHGSNFSELKLPELIQCLLS